MPCKQPRGTVGELRWWLHALDSTPPIPIPLYPHTTDHQAFSNASTSYGLAVVIGNKWHAWKLYRCWQRDGHDIGWAESVTF